VKLGGLGFVLHISIVRYDIPMQNRAFPRIHNEGNRRVTETPRSIAEKK
jgi:hypothetical protein